MIEVQQDSNVRNLDGALGEVITISEGPDPHSYGTAQDAKIAAQRRLEEGKRVAVTELQSSVRQLLELLNGVNSGLITLPTALKLKREIDSALADAKISQQTPNDQCLNPT